MGYTKEEVEKAIIDVLKKYDGKINPSVITQKLNWNKDYINDVCKLFGAEKFIEVLSDIPQINIEKDNNGAAYACIKENYKEKIRSYVLPERRIK
ncbi:hypothetical protein [Treponema putidum]|uniref:hypothetical protein n=1 Tax=Treponema putidum TaxID=221027 RepID=UPI003D905E30